MFVHEYMVLNMEYIKTDTSCSIHRNTHIGLNTRKLQNKTMSLTNAPKDLCFASIYEFT